MTLFVYASKSYYAYYILLSDLPEYLFCLTIYMSPVSQDEGSTSVYLNYPGGGKKMHSVLDGILPQPMCISSPNKKK